MGLSADPPVGAPAGRVQLGTAWGSAVAAPPASFRRATAVASLPAGHGCGLAGGRGAVRDVVCSAFRRRPAGTGGGGDGCRGRGGRLAGLRVPGLPPALAMVAALTSWWVISVLLWGLLVALLVLRRFRYLFVVLIAWTLQGVLIQYPAAASPPSYAPPATRPPASPATQHAPSAWPPATHWPQHSTSAPTADSASTRFPSNGPPAIRQAGPAPARVAAAVAAARWKPALGPAGGARSWRRCVREEIDRQGWHPSDDDRGGGGGPRAGGVLLRMA